jgi:hypothetical protein
MKGKKYFKNLSWLKIILILISLHSFLVGTLLLVLPGKSMTFFGFSVLVENFFQLQGGVFHYVMAIGYFMAAIWYNRYHGLILLAIIAKFFSTIFLFSFYLLVSKVWVVLFSGIVDCLMGLAILWGFLGFHWDLDYTNWDLSDFEFNTGLINQKK